MPSLAYMSCAYVASQEPATVGAVGESSRRISTPPVWLRPATYSVAVASSTYSVWAREKPG
jgi:hypothetical protein